MTMRELALLANVSLSTVSKAFSGADDVSDETRKIIFDLARQYGCYGKYCKQKYEKKVFAILISELNSHYYTEYAEQLQQLIRQSGGIALVSTDNFSPQTQAEMIEYYASYLKVDGIFVFSLAVPLKKGYLVPVISIGSPKPGMADTVYADLNPAILDAVAHLGRLGHRKIAFAGEKLTGQKQKSVESALRKSGMESNTDYIIVSNERFEEAGADAAERLMCLADPPTAVICAYDYIAFGLMNRLSQRGIRVPQDISVIGMDNIHSAKYTENPLTTIDSGRDEICAAAWDLMQKKMNNSFYRLRQSIVINGNLIIRNTTALAQESDA